MARRRRSENQETEVEDYRHDQATRTNNPPAGLAAYGTVREQPRHEYAYNPHLPPVLRFDGNGNPDKLSELLEKARHERLSDDEVNMLEEALKHHTPWLEWAGKQEAKSFVVDPVALHIHERVSTKAILKVAQRENVQRDLFADPQQEYGEAVQFYQHDVDWANRLILGDSLSVMSSLAKREDLAGKVQMIYIDPPYGIKFASNFQPTVFKRDVKEKAEDLTREPEQIKAYRDTWTLGIHSYLTYLRDRLIVAKDLLTDSGSIFVQISDENVHRVRAIMDEVFGSENFISLITFTTSVPLGATYLPGITNYLLWYGKDAKRTKFRRLFLDKTIGVGTAYSSVELPDGVRRGMSVREQTNSSLLPDDSRYFFNLSLLSAGTTLSCVYEFEFNGRVFSPGGGRSWKTTKEGMIRLGLANRIFVAGNTPRYVLYADDYPVSELTNNWTDTAGATNKVYVVQTMSKVIQRCLLMTTDPGDLVLDPTCGSGTTAYVAEQWGRRWIMIDTSRVATTLTRQRLLTGTYDYYKLKNESEGVAGGFINKRVPHITLRSIAQNTALDPIFARHEPILAEKLETLNATLTEVTSEVRTALLAKLAEKERREGKRAITDADRRRWQLPDTAWQEWEVPFETDLDWPEALQEALTDYREAWRAIMDEVNACIAAASGGEELVDQPEVDRRKPRVSGPFTVEAVQPPEESLIDSPVGGEPEELSDTFEPDSTEDEPANAEAYLDKMIRLLRNGGVRFPDNRTVQFAALDPLEGVLNAEGSWEENDAEPNVAVAFGPEHGPVTATQVEHCVRAAYRRGYDTLVFAGFTFDGAAQAAIQADPDSEFHIHMAYVNPDVAMNDLLRDPHTSELFTVFGLPRTALEPTDDGEYIVKMEGVDIYDPVENTTYSANADRVAAWFLDSDYDNRTFCITQAFFPNRQAWAKIARALRGVIDEEHFEQFSGTESFPFPVGTHARVAVKVIDPRGNEVMQVHDLRAENR